MSKREFRRQYREARRVCASCRARKAKYRSHGHVRADRAHVLCFQCFRAARDQMRTREVAQLPFEPAEALRRFARFAIFAPSASLSAAQIHHRERMLAYLRSQSIR